MSIEGFSILGAHSRSNFKGVDAERTAEEVNNELVATYASIAARTGKILLTHVVPTPIYISGDNTAYRHDTHIIVEFTEPSPQ